MASRRPTQADVARLAGVSRGTVSLVLNEQKGGRIAISEETRERVLRAARELGYTPNPVAQMLAGGSNRLIGVFTFEPKFPYQQEDRHYPYLLGIEREASRQDYNVLLFTRNKSPGDHQIYHGGINNLRLADGSILLGSYPDRRELQRLVEEEYPFVFIGRREVPGSEIDWVVSDYISGSATATRYLLELGHQRLGFVGHRPDTEESQDKLAGCRQAAELSGVDLIVLPETLLEDPGELLQAIRGHRLTGLLCRDTRVLSEMLRVLQDASILVPDEISLLSLGAGDAGLLSTIRPTQLRLNRATVGEQAVRALVARLSGAAREPQHILVPCDFIVGETTGPPVDAPSA